MENYIKRISTARLWHASALTAATLSVALFSIPQARGHAQTAEPRIVFAPIDQSTASRVRADIKGEKRRIEKFFGKPYLQQFVVELCPDRAAFDASPKKYAGIDKSEKWMVGMGTAQRLVLLSPRVWSAEAVEHDPKDLGHVRRLIAHELVHVYHGQSCSKPDFDGMDELAWFVEGIATYVSGQLAAEHKSAAREAISAGKAPEHPKDAWKGRYRYGVSGSICRFVDETCGRAVIVKLLRATSNKEALQLLGIEESELLKQWRDYVLKDVPK